MTKEQAQQLKKGDKVTIKFTKDVRFWGGFTFKAGQNLTGTVSAITNIWIGIGGLHIPYHLIEIIK